MTLFCNISVRTDIYVSQVFMALEALSDGGVKMGLSRESAYRLAAQTMIVSTNFCLLNTAIHCLNISIDSSLLLWVGIRPLVARFRDMHLDLQCTYLKVTPCRHKYAFSFKRFYLLPTMYRPTGAIEMIVRKPVKFWYVGSFGIV